MLRKIKTLGGLQAMMMRNEVMTYFEVTQRIIDTIEDGLESSISLECLAEKVNYSLMQVYRIFGTVTGMTLKEYIRQRRLAKALLQLRYSKNSVLDIALRSGYGSPEAFSRAFRELFGVLPIEYRNNPSLVSFSSQKPSIKDFVHKASHEAIDEGLWKKHSIQLYIAEKPAMKFIGKVNRDRVNPSDFYEKCIQGGIERLFDQIEDSLFCCGACLNRPNPYDMHMFCVAVPGSYDDRIPSGLEVFDIPASHYMVFFHEPYQAEEHGSVTASVWEAVKSFQPLDFGCRLNMDVAPVIEIDGRLGYMINIPIKIEQ